MDSQNVFKDRVRERDLDNFLVEELQASTDFRIWFIGKLPEWFTPPEACTVKIHKSPPRLSDSRQTDVSIGWFNDADALQACVLIESKVTAEFQPGQAEAYSVEVREHQAVLGRAKACSLLVAPSTRLVTLDGVDLFNARLSIEDIAAYLTARQRYELNEELAARLSIRANLLLALAGKRSGDKWEPVTVQSKRDFSTLYSDLVQIVAPKLIVRPSADGPKSLTKFFDGFGDLSRFPCGVKLKHEFGRSGETKYANLQFDGQAGAKQLLEEFMRAKEDEGIYIVVSGKSLFARVDTPGLNPSSESFDEQRPQLLQGIAAVAKLASWFEVNHADLANLLAPKNEAPRSNTDLLKLFELELRKLAKRAIDEVGYRPQNFLDMLEDRGAEATAHHLLAGKPSDGFTRLWEAGRLDLSLEALAVEGPWNALFTESELATARRRLTEAGYAKRAG